MFLDNCSAHHSMLDRSGVEVFFLRPNTTAGLQPMDSSVFANFKVLCLCRIQGGLLLNVDNAAHCRTTSGQEPDPEITLLMTVQFIFEAWSPRCKTALGRRASFDGVAKRKRCQERPVRRLMIKGCWSSVWRFHA